MGAQRDRWDEFEITALHACEIRSTWIQVHHVPCAEVVFGGTDDAEDTDAGELLARMAAHRCDAVAEPRVSHVFDVVDVNGTVTAVVHGSRQLDAEEQEAAAEVVRAVDRLLRELRARTGVDALKAVTRLEERYADRIAALREKDAAAYEADLAERERRIEGRASSA
jgi:hypothetical protein